MNLSRVTFEAVHPITYQNFTATYTFSTATVPTYIEPAAAQVEAPVAAPKQQEQQQSTPTTSEKAEEPKWTPATTSSSSKTEEYTPEYTPKTTSSKKQEQKEEVQQWTSSSKKEEAKPAYTPQSNSQSSGGQSGTVTYFYQGGNAGACGNVNSDSSYVAAISPSQYAGGAHCGQQIRISSGGNTITVTVSQSVPRPTDHRADRLQGRGSLPFLRLWPYRSLCRCFPGSRLDGSWRPPDEVELGISKMSSKRC